MRLTPARAVVFAVAVQWALEWLAWVRPWVASAPLAGPVVFVRALLVAAVAVVAVRAGRRWSATLPAVAAGVLGPLAVALVGIATGQFLARGIGPVAVFGYLFSALYVSIPAGVLGAALAVAYQRRARTAAGAA